MTQDRRTWIKSPITIGLTGGSGAGKTTLTRNLINHFGADQVSYIPHDAYYCDLGHLSPEERRQVNFDHPDALDTALYIKHIMALQNGEAIDKPTYDFVAHTRTEKTEQVEPRPIIIVEGILIFADLRLRDLMDLRVFIDIASDVRFIRRLLRDTTERGRATESVIARWLENVRPSHLEFIAPNRRFADVIIPEEVKHIATDLMVAYLEKFLKPDAQRASRSKKPLELIPDTGSGEL
jgi:uridine kinase